MSRSIAIDGPAASGKSSASKLLSKKLNLVMVNSGAMYRAVAWKLLQLEVDVTNEQDVISSLKDIDLQCGVDDLGYESVVGFNGKILNEELRVVGINRTVSSVAKIAEVRDYLLSKQREYLQHHDVVMEGRDIGTVVFPETPYKFFFEASEVVRQARREAEGIQDSVRERDAQDRSRKTAPLKAAPDAVTINTSNMNLDAVVDTIIAHLVKRGWK